MALSLPTVQASWSLRRPGRSSGLLIRLPNCRGSTAGDLRLVRPPRLLGHRSRTGTVVRDACSARAWRQARRSCCGRWREPLERGGSTSVADGFRLGTSRTRFRQWAGHHRPVPKPRRTRRSGSGIPTRRRTYEEPSEHAQPCRAAPVGAGAGRSAGERRPASRSTAGRRMMSGRSARRGGAARMARARQQWALRGHI